MSSLDVKASVSGHSVIVFLSSLSSSSSPSSSAGGLVFKQWKERFVFVSAGGSLVICRDQASFPETEVALGSGCLEILGSANLPRLPPGVDSQSCLGLLLARRKRLLLLAPNTEICNQWLRVLRKVKESLSPCDSPRLDPTIFSEQEELIRGPAICQYHQARQREAASRGKKHSAQCLRHGSSSPNRAMRVACLLVGGAAAGPTLGYAVTSSPPQPTQGHVPDFKDLGFHGTSSCQDLDCAGFGAFSCEPMDQDFDACDFGGGFTF